jgi:hypothetical protein
MVVKTDAINPVTIILRYDHTQTYRAYGQKKPIQSKYFASGDI